MKEKRMAQDYTKLENSALVEEYDKLFTKIVNKLGDRQLLTDFEEIVRELREREEDND